MTRISVFAQKGRVAATVLTLVTGVAQRLPAQPATIITGTVRNAVTGGPVVNATVRLVERHRASVTDGNGDYRLIVDAGPSELRATAIGFAPASRTVALARGASEVIVFELQPSAVPLDEVVTVSTRTAERTTSQSPVPVDVISGRMLENTGMSETWQQLSGPSRP